jgi:hypothetical protein
MMRDPRNQQINRMTDDQIYKYFSEMELNDFQKKAGIAKSTL